MVRIRYYSQVITSASAIPRLFSRHLTTGFCGPNGGSLATGYQRSQDRCGGSALVSDIAMGTPKANWLVVGFTTSQSTGTAAGSPASTCRPFQALKVYMPGTLTAGFADCLRADSQHTPAVAFPFKIGAPQLELSSRSSSRRIIEGKATMHAQALAGNYSLADQGSCIPSPPAASWPGQRRTSLRGGRARWNRRYGTG